MPGNSLIGLLRVDEKKFETGSLFRKSYRQVVDEKNLRVGDYRHAATYSDDLRILRDGIEELRHEASETLDRILLEQFGELGSKHEDATWDFAKRRKGKSRKRPLTIGDVRELSPFHWGYEFDEIVNRRGGFDAIITNPPWDKFKPVAKEFFEKHSALVSKNNMTIHDFEMERERLLDDPEIRDAWLAYLSEFPHQSTYFRTSPDYANQVSEVAGKKQSSDLNLYKLFLERCFRLLSPYGSCGMILQGGFHSDLGAKGLRQMLFEQSRVDSLFVLANERFIFENVDHRQKFCILTFHHGGTTREFPAAFRMKSARGSLSRGSQSIPS